MTNSSDFDILSFEDRDYSEDSDFSDTSDFSFKSNSSSLTDSNTSSSKDDHNTNVDKDYEEEKRKKKYIYNILLKNYPIDVDIKAIISENIKNIDMVDLNYTILISAMVILAKSGNKIDHRFSEISEEVIKNVIMSDPLIQKMNPSNITGLKYDLLRYCRFLLK